MADEQVSGEAIAERVIRLGRSLQARGVDIAIAEIVDASRAVELIDLGAREELHIALRSTMIKDPQHYPQFEAAFERLFPARPPGTRSAGHEDTPDAVARLVAGDDLHGLAADLVDEFGGLDGELRSEGHHMQRAHRGADLARLMTEARRVDPLMPVDELRARIDELKRLMAAEVRAHIGEPDIEQIGPIEDIDFLNASRAELDEVRSAVRPLARRLAARLARRRRSQRDGRINMRRTARRSLTTGGVPMEVAYQRPHTHKPELFVLCDISGSVAEFSLFTLTLVAALSAELARTRSFVFVDGVDEITELLESTDHAIEPWQIMRNTDVIAGDGHSDYGAVFRRFWERFGQRDLRPTSTVLITGDARTNYRDAQSGYLHEIARRCRRVYWLNPEPRDQWHAEDSEMSTYARACTDVFEVRTVRQLMLCVEEIV